MNILKIEKEQNQVNPKKKQMKKKLGETRWEAGKSYLALSRRRHTRAWLR